MRPLVSILVPVYNREDLLAECLTSALSQSVSDLEVVVVDGASTDATWQVSQRFADDDSRVRVFQQPENLGPVAGWRECLDRARGVFGTFLWSDDLLDPKFLEATLPLLEDERIGFAYTAAEIGTAPGSGSIAYVGRAGTVSSAWFLRASINSVSAAVPVSPACALFRVADLRQSFMKELPTDPPVDLGSTGAGTDMLLYNMIALRYPLVAHDPRPLAFFRSHPGSVTLEGRGGLVQLHYALARSWFARVYGFGSPGQVLARHWVQVLARGYRTGPVAAARQYRAMVGPGELIVRAAIEGGRHVARAIRRRWLPRPQ